MADAEGILNLGIAAASFSRVFVALRPFGRPAPERFPPLGYRGEETPVRFRLSERLIEIGEVLDRWLAPDRRYFKVQTAEGIYILRNDITSGEWELTLFERGMDSQAR